MDTIIRKKLMRSALLLVVAVLAGAIVCSGRALAALPPSPCTSDGAGTTTCELWATTGSVTMPDGAVVTVWGYAGAAATPATIPGPVLLANAGDTVVVNLHNDLPENTALLIDEQATMPDLVGAAPGATKSYTIAAATPGTYLYEAGLVPNSQHQVAMGMYGALVVRPATAGQAYDDPATAFNDEALLVLSEIDPALNNSVDPALFDIRDFVPRYYLINGLAYPDTVPITSTAGNTVLLRYVNAGLEHHSMGLLGLGQTVIGVDGSPLAHPYRITAESFAPGQTADVLFTLSISTPVGTKFPLYDGDLLLNNNGAPGFGGMLTFLEVGIAAPPAGAGPATTGVTLVPNPTDGTVDVALSATIVPSTGLSVTMAEYFVDTPGLDGGGVPMALAPGAGDYVATATIPQSVVGAMPAGNHLIYVHGQDSAGNWGPPNFGTLQVQTGGPVVFGLALTPNPSNGILPVALHGSGDSRASGNGNVVAAEYSIDGGAAMTMTVNIPAPVASLDTVILSPTLLALTEGVHTVAVRAQDDLGNWGPATTIDLVQDRTGPATSGVGAQPNPSNGRTGLNPNVAAVRVTATVSDDVSNIKTAEGFIDTPGLDGTGFPFIAADAVFDSLSEAAYADIPLATIALLPDGPHDILVHGKDVAGNWGGTSSVSLLVDRTAPVVSNVVAAPNPTLFAPSVTLTADAADATTAVVAAEWFVDVDPGVGLATPMNGAFGSANVALDATIDVSGWTPGPHTLAVRARDAAGNWSAAVSTVLEVGLANDIFADGFESGNFSAWSATGGNPARISVTSGGAQAGTYKMQATVAQNNSGYVQDNTPAAETTYHARFYFNPNNANVNPTGRTIFAGLDAANQTVFQVQVRRTGGNYQVGAIVSTAGGTASTGWFPIANNAYTALEIAWASGNPASFDLYVGGALQQTLTGLDTSTFTLETVRLGPQGALNGLNGTTWYFDSFGSTRYTVVGP